MSHPIYEQLSAEYDQSQEELTKQSLHAKEIEIAELKEALAFEKKQKLQFEAAFVKLGRKRKLVPDDEGSSSSSGSD